MRKGEQTRQGILETALAEASMAGLSGLSIGGLATKAEMSKSGLFAHFESKQDLQIQVLRTARELFIEKVIAPALKERRGEPRVRALFENWLAWSESSFLPGGCPFVSAATEFDDQPGPLRDYVVQTQQDWLDALSGAARISVEEGHFRADLDTDRFAFDFHSIILAYYQATRLLSDPRSAEYCRGAFADLLARSRA
jgi:AcrR family transcriptional regulator